MPPTFALEIGDIAVELLLILPVFVGVLFVIVVILVIVSVAKGVAEWAHNNSKSVLSVPARVVAKRAETHTHTWPDGRTTTSTTYYCTFEVEGGERLEFHPEAGEYGKLAEGDHGTLTHQGTRYHGFKRQVG